MLMIARQPPAKVITPTMIDPKKRPTTPKTKIKKILAVSGSSSSLKSARWIFVLTNALKHKSNPSAVKRLWNKTNSRTKTQGISSTAATLFFKISLIVRLHNFWLYCTFVRTFVNKSTPPVRMGLSFINQPTLLWLMMESWLTFNTKNPAHWAGFFCACMSYYLASFASLKERVIFWSFGSKRVILNL